VKALLLLAALATVGLPACLSKTASADTLRAGGLRAVVPTGWRGRAVLRNGPVPSAPALNLGTFPLPRADYNLGNSAVGKWPRDAILITVIDWAGTPYKSKFPPAQRLAVRPEDFEGFEGVPADHAFAHRQLTVRGRPLEVMVQFGRQPATGSRIALANEVLSTVQIVRPTASS